VYKISHSWVDVLIVYVVLLEVIQFRDESNKGTATMQPSRPGLSLLTRFGFMVMT
jgi:hypothetical protein